MPARAHVHRPFNRRTFFRGTLVAALGAAAAPALAACSGSQSSQQPEPRGYDGELRELAIPPLYEGSLEGKIRTFTLQAQAGHAEILPGQPRTRTWGFNGDYLGPTLRAKKGEEVKVRVENNLPEMTTVHWHGMKLPAYADGGPHSPIEPGKSWEPSWTVAQPAATVWYHPHPHGQTAVQAYRGLAGMFILDDEVSESLEIPHDYGVDDIPVVLCDLKFTDDDQLDNRIDDTLGLMGTTPVVNGQTNCFFQATTRRVRLRFLNGATMRFYTLSLDNDAPFQVIATDSGLLGAPVEADDILIGPGERVEALVDLAPGEEIKLVSRPREDRFGIPENGEYTVDFGFQDSFDLLTLRGPQDDGPEAPALPAQLDPAARKAPAREGLKERTFVLNTFLINGESMDMARVAEVIDHDKPEIWHVENENADWPHNFHIHNSRFKILDFDGQGIEVPTQGWKDTIDLPPKATATLLVEFGYYPDPTIPYMFHCHMLLHEDEGMMGQFVVVKPGEEPDVRVTPAAMTFDDHAGHSSGHAEHGSIDASRSPYAPTSGAQPAGGADEPAARGNPGGHQSNLDAK